MKKILRDFMLRGMIACGFGPIVWAIIYAILSASGVVETITVSKVVLEVISVSVLAFIAGGINVVYHIEKMPLAVAILIHAMALYADYIVIYLMNGWLASGVTPLVVFTVCFVLGYAVIWLVIYLISRINADKVNAKLESMRSTVAN